jgi:hypothetical protein
MEHEEHGLLADEQTYAKLKQNILDTSVPVQNRLRTLYTLRALGTNEAVDAAKEGNWRHSENYVPFSFSSLFLRLLLLPSSLSPLPLFPLHFPILSGSLLLPSPPPSPSFLLKLPPLTLCPALKDASALLAHEVAYCLGQMQNPYAVPSLIETLASESIHPMVRHEV